MNTFYLETLTLEVPFTQLNHFFLGSINFQCMFSLVYTVYSQKQPLEVFFEISQNTREKHGRVSFLIKLQACKNTFFTEHLWTTASGVEKFHRKTSMVESLFNKVVDTYFEEHLPTPAFVLHLRHSFLISFTLYSAPSFS